MPLQIIFLSALKNIAFLKKELAEFNMQLCGGGQKQCPEGKCLEALVPGKSLIERKNRKQNKVHHKSKAPGSAWQETDLYCWNTGFLHHWRKMLFILSPGWSLREMTIDKTTYTGTCIGMKNMYSTLEYLSFSFDAKSYIWQQHNCGAVFKSIEKKKTSGQSNNFREILHLLAEFTVPHQHIRRTNSVLHFAEVDLKCA